VNREPYIHKYFAGLKVYADFDCLVDADDKVYISAVDLSRSLSELLGGLGREYERRLTLLRVADPDSDRASDLLDETLQLLGSIAGLGELSAWIRGFADGVPAGEVGRK